MALRWGGVGAVLAGALTRASTGHDPFPFWDQDPTVAWAPILGLGPTASALVDVLMLLGAGCVLLGEALAGRGVIGAAIALLAAGAIPAAVHAFTGGRLALDPARQGLTWAAAMAAGVAAMHGARDARLQRVAGAATLSFVAMLVAKGVLDVFVEHARTVADFEANREAFLAARGWSADSAMARTFERRLRQPEATGWFGLANVYASFAGAGLAGLAGVAAVAWRAARGRSVSSGAAGLVTLGAGAAALGVFLAGSKAGYAMAAVGAVLALAAVLAPAKARVLLAGRRGGLVALCVMGMVLGAVIARGMAGEALGERSVLFRWFYLQGAARVIAEHPGLGVGPDGFKQAYMLAKPALSPENVESPHSVAFDFAARLGVLGLAWAGLFFWWVARAGRTLVSEKPAIEAGGGLRAEAWLACGAAAVATLVSAWAEMEGATPEAAAARAAGIAAWMVVTVAFLQVARTSPAWIAGLAGAAVALGAHGQIEMTPVFAGSGALCMIMLGTAGAPMATTRSSRRWPGAAAAAVMLAVGLGAARGVVLPTARWERSLGAGAEAARPLAEIRARLTAVSMGQGADGDSVQRIAADVAAAMGRAVPRDQRGFEQLLADYSLWRMDEAFGMLEGLTVGGHPGTLEAASRLALSRGAVEAQAPRGDEERQRIYVSGQGELGEQLAFRVTERHPGRASGWGWLGTVRSGRAMLEGDRGHLARAVEAWERAASLDPHSLTFPMLILEGLEKLERTEAARKWAARVLEINERLRLDPDLQLTDKQRRRVERLGTPAP